MNLNTDANEVFTAKIDSRNRVTIPNETVKIVGLKPGIFVRLRIEGVYQVPKP